MPGVSLDLAQLDGIAQAELVRTRQLKPVELVEAAIDRIEDLNPQLNAVIIPLFEKAIAQASAHGLPAGRFQGVPLLLKDILCHSAGDPYYQGMRLLRDLGWVEKEDTYLAGRFRQAGFIFVGKTNTSELGLQVLTEPDAYGPTRNPWDQTRSTGGSSGGAAAAVASGMVPVAHGTDGGGSIRIPASACGLVGLKPTRGRTSLGPDISEVVGGIAVEHVLTRSVRDTAAVLDAVCGRMPGDPYAAHPPAKPYLAEVGSDPGHLHIGFLSTVPGGGGQLHPDCMTAVREAAELLESLGHVVEESHPDALNDPGLAEEFLILWEVIAAVSLDSWSAKTGLYIGPKHVEPLTWSLAERGRAHPAGRLVAAQGRLGGTARQMAAWWDRFDLLLTPTLAALPPKLGELVPAANDPLPAFFRQLLLIPFTAPLNTTGQPAISIPLFWNHEGFPIGVQLVADYGREDVLIRIAAQLEAAQPWSNRYPGGQKKVQPRAKLLEAERPE